MLLKKRYLNLADFAVQTNLTNPVQMSPVLTYTVPLKLVVFVDPSLPLNGAIYAQYDLELASGNISSKTVTVTLPYRVSIPSWRTLPVYCILDPGGSKNEVKVGTVTDATSSRKTVQATFTGTPAAEDPFRVLFPIDNARFDLAVISPSGSAESVIKILAGTTGTINTANPTDVRTRARLMVNRIIPALEDYKIAFRVESTLPIVFDGVNEAYFELPIVEGHISAFAKIGKAKSIAEFKRFIEQAVKTAK